MIKNKKERKTMKIDKDKLIDHIINWLDSSIDMYDNEKDYYDYNNYLAMDSQDLKEKINLYLVGTDEFE
jgi:hypothetical protein